MNTRAPRRSRRAFSLIEMLMAFTISATLLAASLVALDAMFKRYTVISDSASTHVISRVVMHRIMSMIRTGSEFGPYPADVLDASQNPADYTRIQFVSRNDAETGTRQVTTIERREPVTVTLGDDRYTQRGPFVLWLVIDTNTNGVVSRQERPLIDGVLNARFNLEYEPGPRLVRATVDLTIAPQSSQYAKYDTSSGAWTMMVYNPATQSWDERRMISSDLPSESIRLVASTSPRQDR
ncbi:MAG: prepilin-type N-terminal cleavage/methylation domain-containing protein [Phycisphaeraceae bacterium]|nr:prepilin-type N-terminal cleavage/methylation domain-containing protein [Phycisphaeraceae bacterium]